MARCPDCTKFVSQEAGEPEVQSEQIDDDGSFSFEVRITQLCADCSTELKEATLEFSGEMTDMEAWEAHKLAFPDAEHSLEIEVDAVEDTDSGPTTRKLKSGVVKHISSRYVKTLYGAACTVTVTCSCGKGIYSDEQELTEYVEASGMEELN